MCGIVGVVAQRNVAHILIEGLKRLEYRGYDSAGLAVIEPETKNIHCLRTTGKVDRLAEELNQKNMPGLIGIAHTRWATHGKPSINNAHPHCSKNQIAVVHNGIIENHEELRQKLLKLGYEFVTETDTEVIVHLLHHYSELTDDFIEAIAKTTAELRGAYAVGIINLKKPNTLYAVRAGSPLVIGIGIEEYFIASGALALLPFTQQFIYLEEGDIAELTINSHIIYDRERKVVTRNIHTSEADFENISKGQYRHYMQKEIFDQPQAILDTIDGHIFNHLIQIEGFGHNAKNILPRIKHIHIVACGTSYHAGLVARHWLESIAKIPCHVDIASEYRYRSPIVPENTLLIALSQSGETADTLAAIRMAKTLGYVSTMGICNVAESSLVREAELLFLTRAGNEIGVAATKTFSAQLIALLLLTLCLKQIHDAEGTKEFIRQLNLLPKLMRDALHLEEEIKGLSHHFAHKHNALFLGRGVHFPIALEGALKLKEISYLHAEAYPAGELKHGPLALVDKDMPVIVVAPNNHLTEKLESNIQEVQARQGNVFLFLDETVKWQPNHDARVIRMPAMPEILSPIIYTIPLQLLAYHIAVLKGTDVDQPRNLAKSVTVE